MHEKSTKSQTVTECYRCDKYRAMDKNVNACVDTNSKPWNTLNYWVEMWVFMTLVNG